MPKKPKKVKDKKARITDTKWRSLKKRGIQPPSSPEENKARATAAHGW